MGPKANQHQQKTPLLDPIQSQVNVVYICAICFSTIHFIITFHMCLDSQEVFFMRFSNCLYLQSDLNKVEEQNLIRKCIC
jgi:hypothetical protein